MKRLTASFILLIFVALLSACTIEQADEPLYTPRTTASDTPSQPTGSAFSTTTPQPTDPSTDGDTPVTTPTTSETTSPSTDGTTAPVTTELPVTTTAPVTTEPPVTTTAPVTTEPPVPSGSVVVTVDPTVVKEGETHTGRSPLPAISLTVNDPENKAGLDDTRIDYSFGVAKDGKPNQISVDHQNYFDSHDRAALTLDTLSTEKVLYLTFDNGYEYNGLTGDILDTLKEKNVPATFFCTLDYLESEPSYVVRMINEGHIVGNHSTTHPVMSNLTREEMAEEILGVENYLRVNYGYSSRYFRFPSGTYTDEALELVDSVGFRSVFWSNAHKDWDTADQPSTQEAFDTVTSRLHPGSVILLHAVSQSNADILADFIDYARANGYVFRSLDQYQGW